MARTNTNRMNSPKFGLIMTTALASVALAGCTASAAPRAETSFSKAQSALENGKADKAVLHAEAAVLAEPRNASYRALLGASYLEAGRFEAAATSFGDAIELGDTDPRTVLSYALAKTALGDQSSAIEMLSDWEGAIDPADLGLAYALAGKSERGIHVLVNTLRAGQNTAKVRQNLAYTYALAGNWRGARVMASEDVPADQIDARLTEWASTAKPEDVMKRVASLLGVSPSNGGGLPKHLALSNFPSQQAMVAEAAAQVEGGRELTDADLVEVSVATSEAETLALKLDSKPDPVDPTVSNILKATATAAAPTAKPAPAPVAKPAPAPAVSSAPRFVSNAVVQKIPEKAKEERKAPRRVASRTSQRRMAATRAASRDKSANSHLVQLGSFDTREVAKAKWKEFQKRFPALKGHDVVITKAKVNDRVFYRVAAAGFGPRSARAMCSSVKSIGRGCFAYAKSSPPKGAVDNGVRIAAR
ncbi:MAG: SPOR domain-containing protein [Erythrobacter sp.]|nr:SPOR domain-containing protein [Erythrobacter sp.]